MQTPAGAAIDAARRKRMLLAASLGVLVAGAFLLIGRLSPIRVYSAQFLIGLSGPFLGPTVAAITLGIVGAGAFDKQFGKNQAFNAAGNVFTALVVAYVSFKFGYRAIFVVAALFALPAAVSLFLVDAGRSTMPALEGRSKDKARRRCRRRDWAPSLRTVFFSVFSRPRFFFTWQTLQCCRNWARCSRRTT
jgi:MFS family permease